MNFQLIVTNKLGTFRSGVQEITNDEMASMRELLEEMKHLNYFKLLDEKGDEVYFGPSLIQDSIITLHKTGE